MKKPARQAGELQDQRGEPQAPSRPVDWYRDVVSYDFENAIARIIDEIGNSEERSRRRTIQSKAKLKHATRALVLDLYSAWKADQRMVLGISRNKNDYRRTSDRLAPPVMFAAAMDAWAGLERLGYMQTVKKGHYDRQLGKGKRTRIKATVALKTLLESEAQLNPFFIRQAHGCAFR